MPTKRLVWVLAASFALVALAAGLAAFATSGGGRTAAALRHQFSRATVLQARGEHGNREAGAGGPAAARYDNRAFPRKTIAFAQVKASRAAFLGIARPWTASRAESGRAPSKVTQPSWQELGPVTPTVPGAATYTGRTTTVSGRVTALANTPTCTSGNCVLYVGTAGGGVWKTKDGLSNHPVWTNSWNGPATNAIGALAVDPNNANVIYAGTGEPSGSSDSEAGVGMYKSTNGGATWTLVQSSVAVSKNRSIGTIAIDPSNSKHILIGTDVARHGDASVNGGRFTPPNAPKLAVYESTNGGSTWTNVLQLPQDTVDPNSANGNDYFAGGITKILFDPNNSATVYASTFTSGLWRRIGGVGTKTFQQIFHAQDPTDTFERTEFALAQMPGGKTRIWAGSGDFSGYNPGAVWRVDDSSSPAATLLATEDAPTGTPTSWKLLTSNTVGDPGFTSHNFCQDQCSYDIGVWSPESGPSNLVVLQGSMAYDDIFGGPPYSNGAAVVRSTNSGDTFQDMTNDTQNPPEGLHPDMRALVFDPANPNIFWTGSDGGVVRIGPSYVNRSSTCPSRQPALDAAGILSCQEYLKAIPTKLVPLNDGLPTLQFQSVTVSAKSPSKDLIGGTQDNGTWALDCSGGLPCDAFESVGGDGGQSAIDVKTPSTRTHSYYSAQYDTNFKKNNPLGWDWISDPLIAALNNGEQFSFYPPFIQDPVSHGYEYTGGQFVYRTTDNGGQQTFLDKYCNELTGDYSHRPAPCGDWEAISSDLTAGPDSDKGTGFIVAIERAPSNKGTMWVGTRRGRIFVSRNAQAAAGSVSYTRIDTAKQPERFPSGISIDPNNPNHAYISFDGYNAYTPTTPGHVFEVTYNPSTHKAQWKDLSKNLGDQPINDVEYVAAQKALYAATDFGVLKLKLSGGNWTQAAKDLPKGAVFGLRQINGSGWLYAATHGRGIWRLKDTPARKLTVKKSGSGKGTVKSTPNDIRCGSKCSALFDDGTAVSLKAKAAKGSKFKGWSGACKHKGTCHLTMKSNKRVTAKFAKVPKRRHR